ncbi:MULTISPECIES: MarR family transcriptional regulator [unclassified Actinopolyspora]|uniref:MarR family transcriptional regulator n=1 Tax=Actinopolyspora TaxID=1849 RepID=UPI0013F675DA|nr:MarR family transcriptional regulator [Actinopolyspora sp. BKK2]NHE75281.1 MarR family transcriptional regulator [Actinopolyspora sp. BKK1]
MELDAAVFHLLRRTLQEHNANWQAQIPELTKPQYAVLRAVDEHPGIEQAAVGQQAAIDKATLASLLPRLEQRGLLSRAVDSGDRRRRLLHLTEPGREVLLRADSVAESVNGAMLARLSGAEREQLRHLLRKLADEPGGSTTPDQQEAPPY